MARKVIIGIIAGLLIAAGGTVSSVHGQLSSSEPASVLIFPLISSGKGTDSLISVTNVNRDFSFDFSSFNLFGDVLLHYYYVSGEDCDVTGRREYLTPSDTLTVLASVHNPDHGPGWLYVVCEDPFSREPCDFDTPQGGRNLPSGIIGDAIFFNGITNFMLAIPAIGVQCHLDVPPPAVPVGAPYILFGGEGTGTYDKLPEALFLSGFFEESHDVAGELVLLPILTSSRSNHDFKVKTNFLFYNNEETVYSKTFSFRCWTMSKLIDIFKGTGALRGDPDEFFIEKGWARISASSAVDTEGGIGVVEGPIPLLGLFITFSDSSPSAACSHLLHHSIKTRELYTIDGSLSPSL